MTVFVYRPSVSGPTSRWPAALYRMSPLLPLRPAAGGAPAHCACAGSRAPDRLFDSSPERLPAPPDSPGNSIRDGRGGGGSEADNLRSSRFDATSASAAAGRACCRTSRRVRNGHGVPTSGADRPEADAVSTVRQRAQDSTQFAASCRGAHRLHATWLSTLFAPLLHAV